MVTGLVFQDVPVVPLTEALIGLILAITALVWTIVQEMKLRIVTHQMNQNSIKIQNIETAKNEQK